MLRILKSFLLAPLKCRFRQSEPEVWTRDALHISIWHFQNGNFPNSSRMILTDSPPPPFFKTTFFYISKWRASQIPKNLGGSWLQGARVFVEGEDEICMGDVATLELRQGLSRIWRIWKKQVFFFKTSNKKKTFFHWSLWRKIAPPLFSLEPSFNLFLFFDASQISVTRCFFQAPTCQPTRGWGEEQTSLRFAPSWKDHVVSVGGPPPWKLIAHGKSPSNSWQIPSKCWIFQPAMLVDAGV